MWALAARHKIIDGNFPKNDPPVPITLELITYQLPLFTTAKTIQKEIATRRLKQAWTSLPPLIQKHLPSTLSTLTSIPFGQSTRTDKTNYFNIDEFKILMQRKLRLPL